MDTPALRILVVEDNEDSRRLLAKRLRSDGMTVFEASTGQEGFAALSATAVDLILLDMHLPDLDGVAFARAVKARPEWAGTVLVACTASVMPPDRAAALGAGCSGFVSKPVDTRSLTARLLEFFRHARP